MPYLPAVENRVLELSSSALRVHRFSRRKSTGLLVLLATVLPVTLPAAVTNYVWDGNASSGGGNARWTRAANWATNTAPPANSIGGLTNTDITFAGSLKTTPLLDNNYFVRSVTFAPAAAAFTITPSSSQQIALGAGGIVNNSTNTQTFLNSLVLSNSQTWNAASGNLSMRGPVNLGANTLTISGTQNIAVTNTIQGSGALIKQGNGTLILAGTAANTFSGGVTIQAGTVTVAKTNALGSGPLTLSGGVLNLGSFNQAVSSFSFQGGVLNSTSGSLSSSSAYQIQAGQISSRLGGAGGLFKTTMGVATLTSSNTYAGGTQITGGKLVVNNLSGSGTGTGHVFVGSGGLLAGTGSISGRVTNALGGSISAGNEIGVLNLGSTVWFGGATNRWDLGNGTGTAGTGWDLLNINGTLTLNATAASKAVIDITSFTLGGTPGLAANFNSSQSYLWTIVQTTGGIVFQPGESELTVFDLLTGNFINPRTGGKFGMELSPDSKSLNVVYAPVPESVPEPDKLAFLGLSVCGMIYGRRLKRCW